ncbi:MAG: hypothetical protein HQL37_08010 [Alphaproteobacteria bacterium]|nr:hypothetical protein [Alphaproteobacteria bacterium]
MIDSATMRQLLLAERDPATRHLLLVGWVRSWVEAMGCAPPFVVGGMVVELWTSGGYMTRDIDIKGTRGAIDSALDALGFPPSRQGSSLRGAPDLDLWVDWRGEGVNSSIENQALMIDVKTPYGLVVRIVGVEDIVADRLAASVFWKVRDAALWAGQILETALETGRNIDFDYLRAKAEKEGFLAELEAFLEPFTRGKPGGSDGG